MSARKCSIIIERQCYNEVVTRLNCHLYHGRKIMTNQRTGNASIIFHNHPLCLPTVLYVGSVPVNEHRLVRVGHFKHHRPCYKLVKELTAQRLWEYPIIVS